MDDRRCNVQAATNIFVQGPRPKHEINILTNKEDMVCSEAGYLCWMLDVVGVEPGTLSTVMFALAPCI